MTGVSMQTLKNFYKLVPWRRVRRVFYWLLLAWLMIFGLARCAHKVNEMEQIKDYIHRIDSNWLREEVNIKRSQWINQCVNNGAAGVLGGATISAQAIEACTDSGFRLYPEQDWGAIALFNHSDFIEKVFLDRKDVE